MESNCLASNSAAFGSTFQLRSEHCEDDKNKEINHVPVLSKRKFSLQDADASSISKSKFEDVCLDHEGKVLLFTYDKVLQSDKSAGTSSDSSSEENVEIIPASAGLSDTRCSVSNKTAYNPKYQLCPERKVEIPLSRDALLWDFVPPLSSGALSPHQGLRNILKVDEVQRWSGAVEEAGTHDVRDTSRKFVAAVTAGNFVTMVWCLRTGVDPDVRVENGATPLHIAATMGHTMAAHILVQAGAQVDVLNDVLESPLHLACACGNAEIAKSLLLAGASADLMDSSEATPLHRAVSAGNLESCLHLLQLGTDPFGLRSYVNIIDSDGRTAFHLACASGNGDLVRLLLQNQADPTLLDNQKNTAIHFAASSGSIQIGKLLIRQGCYFDAQNSDGDTPLHIAVKQDKSEFAIFLLQNGARIDLLNSQEQSVESLVVNRRGSCCGLFLELRKILTTHKRSSDVEKILSSDISNGKEEVPVPCFSCDGIYPPTDFLYIVENCQTSDSTVIGNRIDKLVKCACKGDCVGTDCDCSSLSMFCWYDADGKLRKEFDFNDPPMLFECNRACSCHKNKCRNRVVQKRARCRLGLFSIPDKGWGVKALCSIPTGTFIIEYVGELLRDEEADARADDSYLFSLDAIEGRPSYSIDAKYYGNVARFINHSCKANVVPVKVFVDHQDISFPRIGLFASRDIAASEEICIDYGEKFWQVKQHEFGCLCKEADCRYPKKLEVVTVED